MRAVEYLHLDVQGRYLPPIDTPDSAHVVVHDILSWGDDVTPLR